MKRTLLTLFIALVFVFSSVPVKAEGDGGIPIGGITCGVPGKPACPPPPGAPVPVAAPTTPPDEDTFYKSVIDFLAQIFG